MKRDFSVGAYNEILRLISKIESGPGSGITNWYGSGWYEYASWIDSLGIRTHISDVNSYHNTVVARNIAAKNSVDTTFKAVGEVDIDYGEKFSAINTDLSTWLEYTNQLIEVVNPKNDNFSSSTITTLLDCALVKTVDINAENFEDRFVVDIGDKKLINEEQLTAYINQIMDQNNNKKYMLAVLNKIRQDLANMPPIPANAGRIEFQVGPDMIFYYEVTSSVELGEGVDLNLVIENQRAAFDSFTVSFSDDESDSSIEMEISENGMGVVAGNDQASTGVCFDFLEGIVEMSQSVSVGKDTYEVSYGSNLLKTVIEESIETEVEGGSVTTSFGIEKIIGGEENPDESRVAIAMPVPTSPIMAQEYEFEHLPALEWTAGSAALSGFICQQPEEEINWIAVGGVVIGCVIVIGGIAYFLYTGGDPMVAEKGVEVVAQNAPKVIEYVVPVVEQIGRAA